MSIYFGKNFDDIIVRIEIIGYIFFVFITNPLRVYLVFILVNTDWQT